MDLYHHSDPPFTQWVIANGLLQEKFVVVDVGCQGGEHPRWGFLRDKLEFYGFDPVQEAIEELRRTARPGRKYFEIALGDEDGARDLFMNDDTFSSSFFSSATPGLLHGTDIIRPRSRSVPVRRLDALFTEGAIPLVDYMKLDCEGSEPHVLRGARKYLTASEPICVTSESGFNSSSLFPYSHFQAVNEILIEHRLSVFDINIVRAARSAYVAALRERPWSEPDILTEVPHLDVGAPGTLDIVYCRDLVAEAVNRKSVESSQGSAGSPTVDRLIKAMINFELHGLMDCAFDICSSFQNQLRQRLDVDKAAELLLIRAPHARNTADVVNCLNMIFKLRANVTRRAPRSILRRIALRLRQIGGRQPR
jgi:FkbM family methyltransferase